MSDHEIIAEVNKELEAYRIRISDGVDKKLKKHRKEYQYILNRLEKFYYFTNLISHKELQIKGNSKILFTLYTKSALNLWGVYHCLFNGLEIEASIIERSIYETYINVELIMRENPEERLILFNNYQHFARQEQINHHKAYKKKYPDHEIPVDDDYISEVNSTCEKHKLDYPKKHWASKIFTEKEIKKTPNLYDICVLLGPDFELEYLQLYRTLSKLTHSSAVIEDHYLDNNRDERIIVNAPKFTPSTNSIGAMSIFYCSKVLLYTLKYLDYEYEKYKIFIDDFVNTTINNTKDNI